MTAVRYRRLSESYWAVGDSASLSEHTVGSLLGEQARNRPDTVALVGTPHSDGSANVSPTTLLRRSRPLGAGLSPTTCL